ncbi:TetR/AcrR family transcriptional regulator C-terminal domain-containing protein [Nocardia sp. NBC_01499]|uniref:TetR/AcrR family transcriptional regulator C-terminal domain-containing protein n=1 Tax=Nocardia sp. NBC_01499 TaxID=2903597 RepID=UPI003866EB71
MPGDRRADLEAYAHHERELWLRHTWLAPLLATRPSLGPNWLRNLELTLSPGVDRAPRNHMAVPKVETSASRRIFMNPITVPRRDLSCFRGPLGNAPEWMYRLRCKGAEFADRGRRDSLDCGR